MRGIVERHPVTEGKKLVKELRREKREIEKSRSMYMTSSSISVPGFFSLHAALRNAIDGMIESVERENAYNKGIHGKGGIK
jgi:hypothetical protein